MSEQFSRRHRLTGTPALPDNAGTPAAWSATGEPRPSASTNRTGLLGCRSRGIRQDHPYTGILTGFVIL